VPTMLRAHAAVYASFLAAMIGDAPKAIAYGKEAVTLSEAAGDDAKLIRAMAYGGVSGGARSAGDHVTAYDYAGRAVSLLREMQEPFGLEMSLISQGNIAIALGNFEDARTLLDEGLSLAEQTGDVFRIALALNYLGDLERCEGIYPRAQTMYEKSLARFQEIDAVREVASILHNLAHTYLHQGKRERANELFKESMAMQQAQGNRQGIAECLTGLAAIAISLDQPEQAARLLAASTLLGGENASSIWAAERMEYEKVLAKICKKLTPEQFDAAQNEGKAMTLDQAIQKALLVSEIKQESDGLTEREREVAMMIGQGKSNGEIADEFVLSKRTVEKHVANILSKLHLTSRAQIIRWAIEHT
jgi:DNA-binding CsgD family transcriptional regulator/tetratricopeptide (TPR) repeat protein